MSIFAVKDIAVESVECEKILFARAKWQHNLNSFNFSVTTEAYFELPIWKRSFILNLINSNLLSCYRDTDRGGSMHMDEIVIPQDREQVEVSSKIYSLFCRSCFLSLKPFLIFSFLIFSE